VYFLQFRSNQQALGDTQTKFGLNAGGGIEYFVHRQVAVKGEGRYHAITNTHGRVPQESR
jgi:opacity protein-like surface antigen